MPDGDGSARDAGGDNSAHDAGDDHPAETTPRRVRAKSAVLWGLVGGFAFLVLAQGYLLVGGTDGLPISYVGLFAIAGAIAAASGGIAYATEHRLRAKRRT